MSGETAASWIELQIDVPADVADLVASSVSGVTGGVEIRDAGTLLKAAAGRAVVVTVCAPDVTPAALEAVTETLDAARAAGMTVDPVLLRQRDAREEEWRDIWKQYFRATRVGRSIIVRPSWDIVPTAPEDRVIDLDPGRAFGTGGHATTRLVMTLCESLLDEGITPHRFVDVGCGSGILSIATVRLWPSAVGLAVDTDPEATACTEENLERNQVRNVETRTGSVPVGGGFDLVLANIQADVLTELAPVLTAEALPGAHLVLSGILEDQAAGVRDAFERAGCSLVRRLDEDEWSALLLRRDAAPAATDR